MALPSAASAAVTNDTLQLVLNSDVALMCIAIDMGIDLSQLIVSISDSKYSVYSI
jgi:hypothetical protein